MMTKKLRTELQERIELIENNILPALETRLDGIVARIEWMQIEQQRALGIGQQGPPRIPTTQPRRLLNGSWPLLDGNIYPKIERKSGPLGGYESYVRRSPPATD